MADLVNLVQDNTMFLSLAQRTTALRVDKENYVYLSSWESSGRLSQKDAVEAAVEAAGADGASLDEITTQASRLAERSLTKIQVGKSLRGLSAQFDEVAGVWTVARLNEFEGPD